MKRCCCLVHALLAMAQAATYVNPARCAGCHAEIAASYARTGMARSFASFKPPAEGASYYHEPSQSYFAIVERGGRYYQHRHQTGPDGSMVNVMEKEIDYVVGSGNHARTYLHRTPAGKLVELPLAWYAEGSGQWAMNRNRLRISECGEAFRQLPLQVPRGLPGKVPSPILRVPEKRLHSAEGPGTRQLPGPAIS